MSHPPITLDYGAAVYEYRMRRGATEGRPYSQHRMALDIGVHRSTIMRIEKGHHAPLPGSLLDKTIRRVCVRFGVVIYTQGAT